MDGQNISYLRYSLRSIPDFDARQKLLWWSSPQKWNSIICRELCEMDLVRSFAYIGLYACCMFSVYSSGGRQSSTVYRNLEATYSDFVLNTNVRTTFAQECTETVVGVAFDRLFGVPDSFCQGYPNPCLWHPPRCLPASWPIWRDRRDKTQRQVLFVVASVRVSVCMPVCRSLKT